MPGKIFISCGQNSEEERKIATEIKAWLEEPARGYSAYIAIEAQNLYDINSAIVKELILSDYYIFIDFRRELIGWKKLFLREFRGSLFSHQELALAYNLGFDKVIFLQEDGVSSEGFLKYIQSNSRPFKKRNQILKLIQEEVRNKKWSPLYSRHLIVGGIIKISSPILYRDHTGSRNVYIYECMVENNRQDRAAMNTLAILKSIEGPNGQAIPPDTSYLKWAGQIGYSRTIFPLSSANFCLLQIDCNNLLSVYLQSAADILPRSPIISGQAGNYKLTYQVFAENFPMLEFQTLLNLTGNINTTTMTLV
jgi:hypothetical protein